MSEVETSILWAIFSLFLFWIGIYTGKNLEASSRFREKEKTGKHNAGQFSDSSYIHHWSLDGTEEWFQVEQANKNRYSLIDPPKEKP